MTAPLPRRAWGAICGGDLLVGPLGGAAGGPPAPTPGPPLLSGEAPTNEGELPLRLRGRDWVPAGAACRSRPLCSPGSAGEVVGVALSPAPLRRAQQAPHSTLNAHHATLLVGRAALLHGSHALVWETRCTLGAWSLADASRTSSWPVMSAVDRCHPSEPSSSDCSASDAARDARRLLSGSIGYRHRHSKACKWHERDRKRGKEEEGGVGGTCCAE